MFERYFSFLIRFTIEDEFHFFVNFFLVRFLFFFFVARYLTVSLRRPVLKLLGEGFARIHLAFFDLIVTNNSRTKS